MRYVQQNGILVPQTSRNRQRGFITCGPAFFGSSGSTPPATQTTFSATNKSSDITLSVGNTTASTSSTSTGGIVLSDTAKTTGKFYLEIYVPKADGSDGSCMAGIHLGTSSLTTFLGGDANGFSSYAGDTNRTHRATYNNNTRTNDTVVAGGALLNETARIAVDVGAGKLWLAYFTASAGSWIGGGDPASGTSPTYTFTASSSTYFACCPRASVNVLHLVAPASWIGSAPSGFGVWS